MTTITGSIVPKNGRRKDAGRLHAVRHAVLSRHPLEALRHLGEDLKPLRRIEARFREDLKPEGAVAQLIFDRFYCSYLRCLLAARMEAAALQRHDQVAGKATTMTKLLEGEVPKLILDESTEANLTFALHQEVMHELALVERYDKHYSKEMYRALALLLVLRRDGEPGLEKAFANVFGIEA